MNSNHAQFELPLANVMTTLLPTIARTMIIYFFNEVREQTGRRMLQESENCVRIRLLSVMMISDPGLRRRRDQEIMQSKP